MKTRAAGRAVVILISLSFFMVTCGEMDTLYPSSGTYQVRTLVNNNSLEDCSIIRSQDKIRPYFATSVVNDPDLIGLLVYLLNSKGEIVGEKVRYMLQSYVDEMEIEENTGTVTEKPAETDKQDDKTEPVPPAEVQQDRVNQDSPDQNSADSPPENETAGQEAELPDQKAAQEQQSSGSNQTVVENVEKIINVRSFDRELPYFSIPKDLEPGSYNLVFEALGRKGAPLSRTETAIFYLGSTEFHLKDISLYLPTLSGSQLIPPGMTVMLEAGLDFDSRLDPYVIWYRGRNIISEGKISEGAGTLLWKAPEHADFYSLRVEAFPARLKRGLTGIFREITLPVSPRVVNTGYFFDNNPPYAAKSSLATGINYPEQVRLMVAMILEENSDGTEKNPLTLPVRPELLRWYQFNGSLHDTTATLIDERQLTPVVDEAILQWAAVGQSYGLSVGAEDSYSLSPVSFLQEGQEQGGGIFLSHVKPLAEGVILNAFFPLQSSESEGVWVIVAREGDSIVLYLGTKEKTIELPVYLPPFEAQSFIPVVVEFYIRPYRMEARLSLGEDQFLQHEAESIELPGVLSGEGRIMLGAAPTGVWIKKPIEKPTEQSAAVKTPGLEAGDGDVEVVSETAAISKIGHLSIWNEFAVLFSELPLLHEELPESISDETDQAVQNTAVTPGTITTGEGQRDNSPAMETISASPSNLTPTDVLPDVPGHGSSGEESVSHNSQTENNLTESLTEQPDTTEEFPAAETDNTIHEDETPSGEQPMILHTPPQAH